ncbi:DUF3667 domain-containing protein [Aequorivita lipolytica]|uniref:DUF3667 domain-containing protein n=1 Tax=Aequorivita lipolytica TaxID=153267 RepID=A0A5C6YNE9_9FLAO|nr:DUF3667 domain-containing protein [Aequorivita lipolytica]TXD68931.1 DUF3667 domain-containing protein [Aequorivita lipolytica]SRX53099.1 hypothetical protein AEQU2_02327 [Aequorivita lipolytica]
MKRKKDRNSGSRKSFQYRGTKCLNCQQPLDISDVYCPYCSQLNSNKQLSAKDFFGEFLNSIVVFDSRLRNTLKDLLFRPGIITRNYVKGQRLKYANPFRFFLSVSIIYFLLNSLIQVFQPNTEIDQLNLNGSSSDIITLDSLRQNFPANPSKNIIVADSLKNEESKKNFESISEEALDTMSFTESYIERFSLYNKYYEKTKIKSPAVAFDSLHHQNTAFNRWVYSKNATLEKIQEKPSEFINYVISKIPFFLFFFTPFFALFFWLIYSRKKYTYIEHTIFIFHIFSFIFLAMLLFLIPDLIIGKNFLVGCLFIFIGPIYFYKALRNFYGQSRPLTLIKFVFLNTVFVIGLTLAATIFVVASAAIY